MKAACGVTAALAVLTLGMTWPLGARLTSSVPGAVSCGTGNTAMSMSRTLAVESAGKTSNSNWRFNSGSRA